MFPALVFSLTCVAILLLVIWRLSMFPCCVNGMSGLLNVIANGDSFAAAIIWNFVVFVLIFQRFSISLMLFIGFVSLLWVCNRYYFRLAWVCYYLHYVICICRSSVVLVVIEERCKIYIMWETVHCLIFIRLLSRFIDSPGFPVLFRVSFIQNAAWEFFFLKVR